MRKNVFVLALDDFHLALLKTIRRAENYDFRGLLSYGELVRAGRYPMEILLPKAEEQLRSFGGVPDGLIAYYDFPSSTLAPVLRRKFDLPGPSFESVLRCEHKYWSRIAQQQIVPELIPRFCPVNPFAAYPLRQISLDYPFWLKPVRAHSSHLGFLIEDERQFLAALAEIRDKLPRCAEPFNYLLRQADLPPKIAEVDGYHCIAEEIISADCQVTLEGYVYRGRPRVYGIVDSLREEGGSSFTRYQYPSLLPESLQRRMILEAEKIMAHIGLDDGPFNLEFFFDGGSDRLTLLEINARISKSHSPLFAMVEGASQHEVAVELAVGEEPSYPRGEGEFKIAAKFMLRRFEDAIVARVPSEEDLRRIQKEIPGVMLEFHLSEGDRLSRLQDQDSYSYEYGTAFIGGENVAELEEKFEAVKRRLPIEFENVQ